MTITTTTTTMKQQRKGDASLFACRSCFYNTDTSTNYFLSIFFFLYTEAPETEGNYAKSQWSGETQEWSGETRQWSGEMRQWSGEMRRARMTDFDDQVWKGEVNTISFWKPLSIINLKEDTFNSCQGFRLLGLQMQLLKKRHYSQS